MDFNNIGPLPTSSAKSTSAKAGMIEDFSDSSRGIRSGGSLSASLMNRCVITHDPAVNSAGVADSGSFCLVDDPLSRQRVIDQLRHESSATVCITSLTDLERDGLLQQTVLDGGQLHKTRGRLFTDEPLTLIIDLCAMAPGSIASVNDLLESDPHCNGQPLGRHIRRVLLVNTDMLQGRQLSNPDLWRRLGQMCEQPVPPADDHTVTDETLLAQITNTDIPGDKPVKVIDFALHDDWHHYLFGGITLNWHGELIFAAGALANLAAGAHLVLRNAPWEQADFQTALATAVRLGGFTANGQWVALPGGLTLSSEPFCLARLEQLKRHMLADNSAFDPARAFVCLNPVMVESIKGTLRVEGAKVVQTNLLSALVADCRQLVITAPLSDKQWYWLLHQLESLATPPALFIDVPPSVLLGDRTKETPDGAFTYRVSIHDSQESLQQLHLSSQKSFTFSLTSSPLLQNLMAGNPVILTNLEQNPRFAARIETLLLPSPYLFVHGHKIDLPRVNLTVLSGETGSPLIDQLSSAPDKSPQNPLYRLLLALPASFQKRYPATLPWEEDEFNRLFEQQSDAQRRFDGSPLLLTCHQREALHILLAKAYRGDARVYGYVKAKIAELFPDQSAEHRADGAALRQWLVDNPKPNRELLKREFWVLARHCPGTIHQSLEFGDEPTDEALHQLALHLAGAAPDHRQRAVARRLGVGMHELVRVRFYDGLVRATVRDALVAGKAWLPAGTVLSQTLAELTRQLETVLNGPELDKLPLVREILTPLLKRWPASLQDLPRTLVWRQRHAYARQERRLIHLAERVKEHPVVFLQGPAGVGKSFMARTIAGRAGFSACQVVQLGPGQTRDSLCGGPELVTTGQDSCTRFKPGTLIQWATEPEKPPLLVLDEANLAPKGTLAPLAGLSRQTPVLDVLGNQYVLSSAHRIILTGNPSSYPGRNPVTLPMPTLYYHELDRAQTEAIIRPKLPPWLQARRQVACDRLLSLFHHFREIVALTSIRDLSDVLATVYQILRYHPTPLLLSEEQINALVYRAFMDSLAGAVLPGPELHRLRCWYHGQFVQDTSVLAGVDNAFAAFLTQLQVQNPDASFTSSGVRQLVYRYWQSLDKGNAGRSATLVEGPSGWGKDFVLGRTIRLWQQLQGSQRPFIHINANPNRWTELVASVHRAMAEGLVIAISELNLIGSADLEELLNLVLTGQTVPGFHLFATINPSSFVGREVLSPALKSRCTQMRLPPASPDELMVMVQALTAATPEQCHWLASHFYQLSMALTNQQSPVHLVLDDLLSSARHLTGSPPEQWADAFKQHLALAFRSLKAPLPAVAASDFSLYRADQQHEVEPVSNSVPVRAAPVRIRFGIVNAVSDERVVTVVPEMTPSQPVAGHKAAQAKRPTSLPEKRQERRSPVSFADITVSKHVSVTRYFPADLFDTRDYRLKLQQTLLDEDGELSTYPILWSQGSLKPFNMDNTLCRTDIGDDELPGRVELFLSSQWQSLPGLTPEDQLRAIRVSVPVELARSKLTGQLLIRRRHDGEAESVVVDFIIAPQMQYFTRFEQRDSPVTCQHLCTPQLQALLDEHVFYPTGSCCPSFKELQHINRITPLSGRLNSLIEWLDTFGDSHNITGKGGQLLLDILSKKQGVCRHKAMIFQLFCHYWEIPARLVWNDVHVFAEVSFDGGSSWRQYQVGGGGRICQKITEPDWGKYSQTTGSLLKLDWGEALSCASLSRQDRPDVLAGPVSDLLLAVLQKYGRLPMNSRMVNCGILPYGWEALLSPQCFDAAGSRTDLLDMVVVRDLVKLAQRGSPEDYFEERYYWDLKKMIRDAPATMINDAWLNWLCSLYQRVPDYAKRILLAILQWQTGSGEHQELSRAVARISLSYPLKPEEYKRRRDIKGAVKSKVLRHFLSCHDDIEHGDEQEQNLYRAMAKALPRSRWLSDKLIRHSISRRLHYCPGENSVLIPEKMLAGGPAFLHQATAEQYKTVIFDLVSTEQVALSDKIEQMNQGIKPELLKGLLAYCPDYHLNLRLKSLYICWLATHQGSNTSGPIWLFDQYQLYSVTPLPTNGQMFLAFLNSTKVRLPVELIKEYFCQPDAQVVQGDDFLRLFDEFLGLISA